LRPNPEWMLMRSRRASASALMEVRTTLHAVRTILNCGFDSTAGGVETARRVRETLVQCAVAVEREVNAEDLVFFEAHDVL